MKKLFRIIPLIVLVLGIIIVPLKTRALDFGNVAGDEDFSYDSEWEVE